ncbi:MAG: hypothetical protein LLG04_13085 [Parachlamydia sp.]|nr:hypothetical protein [Parachlamydia sp.]
MIHLKIGLFKFKPIELFGTLSFAIYFINFRVIRLDRDFLSVALLCLSSMVLSAIFGHNLHACLGFVFLFLFNYIIFFIFPTNLLQILDHKLITNLYFLSFIPIGWFASAQVFFSLFGITLPFATQNIYILNRGQAFTYEPSFYALYMTPLAIFYTARFLLQKKKERNLKQVLNANFLLLISTSTGCFFSYIALILSLGMMKLMQIVRNVSFLKVIWRFSIIFSTIFLVLWITYPALISSGFLKLFWAGIVYHHTFQARWGGIEKYWNVFLDLPILGAGLGGTTTYLVKTGELNMTLDDPELLTTGIAMNVTTEILASLGLVGAVAFGYFFFILWKTCRKTLRLDLTTEERINVLSFIASLCVMFFALQFSQSIMRAYVWLHVGICVGYMKHLQNKYRELLT